MSFARPERDPRRALSLTPLIDVMFILIIFFVTTTTFRAEEQQIDVQLVATQTGKVIEPTRTEIVINVKEDGTITIGNRLFDAEQLKAMLRRLVEDFPNERVIVRGDRNAKYERVLAVLDSARAAGVRDARLATQFMAEEAGR